MPELEPITREEKFLNGEVGMTPITREEKILAGEDVETITRREYFLKNYRGGGGTSDYKELTNKPSINGTTLDGELTTGDLNISYNDLDDKPSIPSGFPIIEKIPFTYSYPNYTLEKSIFDYDIIGVFLASNSVYAADDIHMNPYMGDFSFVSTGNVVQAADTVIRCYHKFSNNEQGEFVFKVGGSGDTLGKILVYQDYSSIRTGAIYFVGIKF